MRTIFLRRSELVGSRGMLRIVGIRSMSSHLDLRRQKIRSQLVKPFPEDEDAFVVKEGIGLDMDVNWTLVPYGVYPRGLAFRNHHLRGILNFAKGSLDENKGLVVEAKPAAKSETYYVVDDKEPVNLPKGAKVLSTSEYRTVMTELREHLSDADQLWLEDKAFNSDRSSDFNTRIITEDASTALYFSHILHKQPRIAPADYKPDLLAFLGKSFSGSKILDNKPFQIIDFKRKIFAAAGYNSASELKSNMMTLLFKEATKRDSLPLSCHRLKINGSSVLVFDVDDTLTSHFPASSIGGTSQVFWGENGVANAWAGNTLPHTAKAKRSERGDLVEKSKSGSRITIPQKSSGVEKQQPKAIVFLLSDKSGSLPTVSKLNSSQAAAHLVAGYSGQENSFNSFHTKGAYLPIDAKAIASKFEGLVKSSGATAYLVNINRDGKDLSGKEVTSLMEAIASGAAREAKTSDSSVFSSPYLKSIGDLKLSSGDEKKAKELSKQIGEVLKGHGLDSSSILK